MSPSSASSAGSSMTKFGLDTPPWGEPRTARPRRDGHRTKTRFQIRGKSPGMKGHFPSLGESHSQSTTGQNSFRVHHGRLFISLETGRQLGQDSAPRRGAHGKGLDPLRAARALPQADYAQLVQFLPTVALPT